MSTANAPLEIGRVRLTVNDIETVGAFYEQALGLKRMHSDATTASFGAGGRVLVDLTADPTARRASPREAGLFHTALLLPSRADLAAWLRHAVASRLALQGASDHLVSEAIYLADPEGNGIEVYTDRPREGWTAADGSIRMATDPLDLDDLAAQARAPWTGAPDGTVIGHVHLRVGAVPEAEAFYAGTLGFAVTAHYPGAAFFGAGGYHHHLGANVWNSRGAGQRSPSTGLAGVELLADADSLAAIAARTGGKTEVSDPWGTVITLTRKAA
jgi:catechol 2,3-dioxygenase